MVKSQSSIRVAGNTYSKLVRVRGLLESFQARRLSLDDAVFISAVFTFNVLEYLSQCVGDGKLVVGSSYPPDAHGELVMQVLSLNGSTDLPVKVLKKFSELTEVLGKPVPRRAKSRE